MAVIQHVRLTPLIVAAEKFETGHAESHKHDAGTAAHTNDDVAWAPSSDLERTVYTALTSVVAGAGFAAMLAGISILSGWPITRRTGLLWGLCGFTAVSLAPAAGLPPELPGMQGAELVARQLWWLMTIVFTSAALWLLATGQQNWSIPLAIVLAALPHMIGAPQPLSHETAVSTGLIQSFVANSLAANALFWVLIGVSLGYMLDPLQKDIDP